MVKNRLTEKLLEEVQNLKTNKGYNSLLPDMPCLKNDNSFSKSR